MDRDRFIAAREHNWQRLEEILARMRSGRLAGLTAEEVLAFGLLYRQATSDLAIAQRDFPQDRLTLYLNALVAQTHPFVYRSETFDLVRLARFFTRTFPRAFRSTLPFFLASVLLTVAVGLGSFIATVLHPEAAQALFPQSADLVPVLRRHQLWVSAINGENSVASVAIWTNNIRVAIVAFAGGALAGLGTLYIILFNALMLGTIAGLAQYYGMSGPLWSFIAAHGVIELSVIFIGGGAGFLVGWAFFRPGLRSRRRAIGEAGRSALILLVGSAPLLIVAGTLEGFLSPSDAPGWLKLLVGLTSGVLLYSYLLLAGRTARRRAVAHLEPAGSSA